jgi:hypothetical protein
MLGAVQNKIRFIVLGMSSDQTKHATIALRIDA